jgi:hypothetical protein
MGDAHRVDHQRGFGEISTNQDVGSPRRPTIGR